MHELKLKRVLKIYSAKQISNRITYRYDILHTTKFYIFTHVAMKAKFKR
ncbi:hypothetical protein CAMRE0001_1019 [Campylobacter rectus RM3267]|uniref:Uncharacterized protein n=1 Tax=Campylobacter rectus RM3267 TaxID=553218 RepID=B9D2S2_CAMRE|nr:hypothetical protein CAMRE0001_1019 [Campylobacter rectus RM3267]